MRRSSRFPLGFASASWSASPWSASAAPWLAPYDEGTILTDDSFVPPGDDLVLGGDFLGRDIASRLLYGARVTLSLALAISALAFLIGCATGFLAAVRRGWVDTVLSRLVDALISFPAIMIALIVISGLGSSFGVLIVTIALIDSTRVFRVARALGMDIAVQDYVEAARARGEKLGWIMWHELLPNALAPLAAEFGIRFTYAILFISALSFLGLGVQPPHADLGVMVKENMQGLLYGLLRADLSGALHRRGHGLRQHAGRLVPEDHGRSAAERAVTMQEALGPPPLLDVRNLSVVARQRKQDPLPIVEHVSFALGHGEVIALIGESGSGKTTISLACMGYAAPRLRDRGRQRASRRAPDPRPPPARAPRPAGAGHRVRRAKRCSGLQTTRLRSGGRSPKRR